VLNIKFWLLKPTFFPIKATFQLHALPLSLSLSPSSPWTPCSLRRQILLWQPPKNRKVKTKLNSGKLKLFDLLGDKLLQYTVSHPGWNPVSKQFPRLCLLSLHGGRSAALRPSPLPGETPGAWSLIGRIWICSWQRIQQQIAIRFMQFIRFEWAI